MSLSLSELLEEIYNCGMVKSLLDSLNCTDFKLNEKRQGDPLITARLPNSSNPRGIQIYLSPKLHTELVGVGQSGNIYNLVGYVLYECKNFEDVKNNLYQITTYIKNVLGIDDNQGFTTEITPKIDYNSWLRPIQKKRTKEFDIPVNNPINHNILNEFILGSYSGWKNISPKTQNYFQIGYHLLTESVTIPLHNKNGDLIGIKTRYDGKDEYRLNHKKYSYLYPISKSIELFNLNRSIDYIKQTKKVIIFEGAKSTIQCWDWDIKNTVSIEGDSLSPVQVRLIKELGIDIELIFAWDKGKDEEFVMNQLKQIKGRKISYLYDNNNRFDDKDSPIDKGYESFIDLIKNDKHNHNPI